MEKKTIFIMAGVLLGILCLCITAVLVLGFGRTLVSGDGALANLFASATPMETATLAPTQAPADATDTPASPALDPSATAPAPEATAAVLPADIAAQMDRIQSQVSRLRGMHPLDEVNRALMTPEQLRARLEADFAEDNDPDEVRDDLRVLAAFGLIDPEFDLYNYYLDLMTEQISGFYDSETKEMFVIQGETFSGPERSTYAHEYTHVLQDQQYDLQEGLQLKEEYCKVDSERCAAVQALIEGEASLVEQAWLYSYGTDQDRAEIEEFYNNYDSPLLDAAPAFLVEDLTFPYREGIEFVFELFQAGGWDAIDEAYTNLPVTTEQILHPEKYPSETPIAVDLPDLTTLIQGRLTELDRGVLGEWYAYLMLAFGRDEGMRLDEDTAREASSGWGGDAYVVYWDENAHLPVAALQMVWDSMEDAEEFADAFADYGRLRWGETDATSGTNQLTWEDTADGTSRFLRSGVVTLWVLAPNSADTETLEWLLLGEPAGLDG